MEFAGAIPLEIAGATATAGTYRAELNWPGFEIDPPQLQVANGFAEKCPTCAVALPENVTFQYAKAFLLVLAEGWTESRLE